MMRNYGNVFSTTPGRCFRFVTDGFGKPGQCMEDAVTHGTFRDDRGQLFEVDACEFHAADLESPQPMARS
ncbi:MAG TPA: hypothetical protein VIJ34_13765 [Acidimicrobiales bacterium]